MHASGFNSLARAASVLMLLAGTGIAHAAGPPPSRFTLESGSIERAAEGNGRFAINGRIAPEPKVGDLRESSRFAVIGRIAAPFVNCAGDNIFANGFE